MAVGIMAGVRIRFMRRPIVSFWSGADESLILVNREFRQLPQKRHNVPKNFIIVRYTPGRHARHFDSVLYDPEIFSRGGAASPAELRRPRIETSADLGPIHPRSKVTAAAHLSILPRS
jgi:hypothetical protein